MCILPTRGTKRFFEISFSPLSCHNVRCSTFSRVPILLILDAYDCHMNLVVSKRLTTYNVFIVLFLEKIYGSDAQPLGVGANRGFQLHYALRYDKYIFEAQKNLTLYIAGKNPKVPHYFDVS